MRTFIFANEKQIAATRDETTVCAAPGIEIERVTVGPEGTAIYVRAVTPVTPDTRPTWVEAELARAGRKISAIKAYRERTGLGLRESKEAIDKVSPSTGY